MSNTARIQKLEKSHSHKKEEPIYIVTDEDLIFDEEVGEEIIIEMDFDELPSRSPPTKVAAVRPRPVATPQKRKSMEPPVLTVQNAERMMEQIEVKGPSYWRRRRFAFYGVFSLIVGGLISLVVIVGGYLLGNRLTGISGQITQAEDTISRKVEGASGQVVSSVSTQIKDSEAKILDAIKTSSFTKQDVDEAKAEIRERDQRIAVLNRERINAIEEAARARKEVQSMKSPTRAADDIDLYKIGAASAQADDPYSHDHALVYWIAGEIAAVESSWRYTAKGTPFVRGGKTDQAVGKYQILKSNVAKWTEEALGRSYSVEDFVKDPRLQEKTALFKIREYVETCRNDLVAKRQAETPKRVLDCVARFWIAGPKLRRTEARDVITGKTVTEYALEVVE